MKGVTRKPSDKKRETHIGNDADAPSEVWGDEVTTDGADKHLMELAGDESVELPTSLMLPTTWHSKKLGEAITTLKPRASVSP